MAALTIDGRDIRQELLDFSRELVRAKSYSGQEEGIIRLIEARMRKLGYDEVAIDGSGSVVGRVGSGSRVLMFDSHVDTVAVTDEESWSHPPFGGDIVDGFLWGRGSVDMKGGAAASIYAGAVAKSLGLLEGKTVFVSSTTLEEDCDGETLRSLLEERGIRPAYMVICEPSANVITTGHKGKAQIVITTRGVAAHGSAPEKGVNAIYEMAEVIERVRDRNLELMRREGRRGTLVMSRISSTSASMNAVPSECEVYLDRRMVPGETEATIREEMSAIIAGKQAEWRIGTLRRRTWTGRELVYEPFHLPWEIGRDEELSRVLGASYRETFGLDPSSYDYWDFSTNAVSSVRLGIPTIGFGPGEYKLAHMRDERCPVEQITQACAMYAGVIRNI